MEVRPKICGNCDNLVDCDDHFECALDWEEVSQHDTCDKFKGKTDY